MKADDSAARTEIGNFVPSLGTGKARKKDTIRSEAVKIYVLYYFFVFVKVL